MNKQTNKDSDTDNSAVVVRGRGLGWDANGEESDV